MKEIKFRGKRIDNNEWVDGSYVYAHKWFGTGEAGHFIVDIYGSDRVLVKKETIGQYTRFKDKNGKEIYEGDIVGCFGNTQLFEVKYCLERGGYFLDGLIMLGRMLDKIEVIGNKFDNPELIEK